MSKKVHKCISADQRTKDERATHQPDNFKVEIVFKLLTKIWKTRQLWLSNTYSYAAYGTYGGTTSVLKKEFKDRDPFLVVFSTKIFPYTADNFRLMYSQKRLSQAVLLNINKVFTKQNYNNWSGVMICSREVQFYL